MKEDDFKDMNPDAFRNAIEYFADSSNDYSKEDLYTVFIVVARLYLEELINARQLENLFVERFGEDKTNEFFEAVANSSEAIKEADLEAAFEENPEAVIRARFDLLDRLGEED